MYEKFRAGYYFVRWDPLYISLERCQLEVHKKSNGRISAPNNRPIIGRYRLMLTCSLKKRTHTVNQ
jgi:hypothetical protein